METVVPETCPLDLPSSSSLQESHTATHEGVTSSPNLLSTTNVPSDHPMGSTSPRVPPYCNPFAPNFGQSLSSLLVFTSQTRKPSAGQQNVTTRPPLPCTEIPPLFAMESTKPTTLSPGHGIPPSVIGPITDPQENPSRFPTSPNLLSPSACTKRLAHQDTVDAPKSPQLVTGKNREPPGTPSRRSTAIPVATAPMTKATLASPAPPRSIEPLASAVHHPLLYRRQYREAGVVAERRGPSITASPSGSAFPISSVSTRRLYETPALAAPCPSAPTSVKASQTTLCPLLRPCAFSRHRPLLHSNFLHPSVASTSTNETRSLTTVISVPEPHSPPSVQPAISISGAALQSLARKHSPKTVACLMPAMPPPNVTSSSHGTERVIPATSTYVPSDAGHARSPSPQSALSLASIVPPAPPASTPPTASGAVLSVLPTTPSPNPLPAPFIVHRPMITEGDPQILGSEGRGGPPTAPHESSHPSGRHLHGHSGHHHHHRFHRHHRQKGNELTRRSRSRPLVRARADPKDSSPHAEVHALTTLSRSLSASPLTEGSFSVSTTSDSALHRRRRRSRRSSADPKTEDTSSRNHVQVLRLHRRRHSHSSWHSNTSASPPFLSLATRPPMPPAMALPASSAPPVFPPPTPSFFASPTPLSVPPPVSPPAPSPTPAPVPHQHPPAPPPSHPPPAQPPPPPPSSPPPASLPLLTPPMPSAVAATAPPPVVSDANEEVDFTIFGPVRAPFQDVPLSSPPLPQPAPDILSPPLPVACIQSPAQLTASPKPSRTAEASGSSSTHSTIPPASYIAALPQCTQSTASPPPTAASVWRTAPHGMTLHATYSSVSLERPLGTATSLSRFHSTQTESSSAMSGRTPTDRRAAATASRFEHAVAKPSDDSMAAKPSYEGMVIRNADDQVTVILDSESTPRSQPPQQLPQQLPQQNRGELGAGVSVASAREEGQQCDECNRTAPCVASGQAASVATASPRLTVTPSAERVPQPSLSSSSGPLLPHHSTLQTVSILRGDAVVEIPESPPHQPELSARLQTSPQTPLLSPSTGVRLRRHLPRWMPAVGAAGEAMPAPFHTEPEVRTTTDGDAAGRNSNVTEVDPNLGVAVSEVTRTEQAAAVPSSQQQGADTGWAQVHSAAAKPKPSSSRGRSHFWKSASLIDLNRIRSGKAIRPGTFSRYFKVLPKPRATPPGSCKEPLARQPRKAPASPSYAHLHLLQTALSLPERRSFDGFFPLHLPFSLVSSQSRTS